MFMDSKLVKRIDLPALKNHWLSYLIHQLSATLQKNLYEMQISQKLADNNDAQPHSNNRANSRRES